MAAGHDRFPAPLVEEHLGKIREALHLSYEDFQGLGRVYPADHSEPFCMTVLALKLSRYANGVSALHGTISRRMWQPLYHNAPEESVPIGHITNGVHVPTWLAPAMFRLYDRHLGPAWHERSGEARTWEGIESVDDAELWETHLSLKARLLEFARRCSAQQEARRGETADRKRRPGQMLSPDALTIGFARRFATYKRASLILKNMELLTSMVNDPKRPVQFEPVRRTGPEPIRAGKRF